MQAGGRRFDPDYLHHPTKAALLWEPLSQFDLRGGNEFRLAPRFWHRQNPCTRLTAHPAVRDKWKETDATYGQSQIAAMLVQDMFGGNIRLTHIDGEKHYFNEVDGKTIDLTSDHYEEQFIMINFADSTEVDRAECDADADVLARYELLQKRVDDYIDMVTR